MKCVSCDNEHDENFCPNCGEKGGIKKITFVSIFENTFSSIIEMDMSFLFNLKTLIFNPQQITADYIRGKRKGILNPISFLVFSVTTYLIVITLLKRPVDPVEIDTLQNALLSKEGQEAGKFIRANLKYFWILSIIPLSLSLRLIYKKYNYAEHIAISSFVIGQATLAAVVSYVLFKIPLIFDPIVYVSILWLVYSIFKDNSPKFESFLLSFVVLFLFIFQLSLIILMIVLSRL